MSLETINLDKERLEYRAEGNANLVLALLDRHMVLRLRKTSACCCGVEDLQTEIDLQRTIAYVHAISTLFRPEFVVNPQIVMVKTADCAAFNRWLRPQRPVHRLEKLVCCSSGVLCPDVAFLTDAHGGKDGEDNETYDKNPTQYNAKDVEHGAATLNDTSSDCCPKSKLDRAQVNTIAIEIKPKQGWMNTDGKSSGKCRFCYLQYLKLAKGSITQKSNYCPLDLYSGDRSRMARAINELIRTPQNNFRLFINGSPIFGDGISSNSFDEICDEWFLDVSDSRKMFIGLVIESLLKDFDSPIISDTNFEIISPPTTTPCMEGSFELPEKCILSNMLTLQQLVKDNLAKVTGLDDTEAQSATHVDHILSRVRCTTDHLQLNDLTACEQYLLGATILDSSIMITCRRASAGDWLETTATATAQPDQNTESISVEALRKHAITIDNQSFVVQVTIMDLDPKSLNHSKKYVKQLKQSRIAYETFFTLNREK